MSAITFIHWLSLLPPPPSSLPRPLSSRPLPAHWVPPSHCWPEPSWRMLASGRESSPGPRPPAAWYGGQGGTGARGGGEEGRVVSIRERGPTAVGCLAGRAGTGKEGPGGEEEGRVVSIRVPSYEGGAASGCRVKIRTGQGWERIMCGGKQGIEGRVQSRMQAGSGKSNNQGSHYFHCYRH